MKTKFFNMNEAMVANSGQYDGMRMVANNAPNPEMLEKMRQTLDDLFEKVCRENPSLRPSGHPVRMLGTKGKTSP